MPAPYMDLNPKKGSFWEHQVGRRDVVFVSHPEKPKLCIGKIEKRGRGYVWTLYEKEVPEGTTLKTEPEVAATEKCGKITNAVFSMRQLHSVRNATDNNTMLNF